MNLLSLREPDGPYWAAYQETRHRDEIGDDPDYVPPWFLAKLARNRIAEARVAVEQRGDVEHRRLFEALRTVENELRTTTTLEPVIAEVVAALLGAAEEETARERAESVEAEPVPLAALEPLQRLRHRVEARTLAGRHLVDGGITDADDLTLSQRRRAHMQAEQFGHEWAALRRVRELLGRSR